MRADVLIPVSADPAHDYLTQGGHGLDSIFMPRSVAVIGATETPKSVGRTLLWNLVSSPFGGTVYPVNPKRANVLGVKAYPNIAAVPETVDLAVIVTPAGTVPGIIAECAELGIKGAIVISAGFKELGAPGVALEQQILRNAKKSNMRIVGPNCLGVMNPLTGFNATFAGVVARPGNVAFISQSGALCTAVLDWSIREQVGFSAFVSIGSMLDVGWGDLIDYLGNDPRTKSIVIYMETIGDAKAFLSAAKEVALSKPIIVIKAGRTAAAAKAAASHTGSLTGSDEVLDAAFRRVGVLRVDNIGDLFSMSAVLAKQPLPKGPRLTIITNAGGPGVLATDALITSGGELTDIGPQAMQELNKTLPPQWSHNNPIDVLGDAAPERYAKSLEIAGNDPNSDGLLVILTPQDMTDATQTAEKLKPYAQLPGKPVLASWMGGPAVAAGDDILTAANIPTFAYPDEAAKAFTYMWRYALSLKQIYETPILPQDDDDLDAGRREAAELLAGIRKTGRSLLTEYESKKLLKAYGIPTVPTAIATTADEAVAEAKKIGFPVVLKLHSLTITHKTDVGGVQLNLLTPEGVAEAFERIRLGVTEKKGKEHFQGVTVQPMEKVEGYEIILGSSLDSQFGPVLLFGSGGQLVEVYKDRSLGLPPLNATLARRMMEQTKIYTALKGVRGRKSVNMALLESTMVRFSQMIAEQRLIKECDINPLLCGSEKIIALDARVVLHDADVDEATLPSLPVRPYPAQYVSQWTMSDKTKVTVRPIRPEDEPLMAAFQVELSERTVRQRYGQSLELTQRVAHDLLIRTCCADYAREIPLVVVQRSGTAGDRSIMAIGRLSKLAGNRAKFAMTIADRCQGKGLGTHLLSKLIEVATAEKMVSITADILTDNTAMQQVCRSRGFTLEPVTGTPYVRATLALDQSGNGQ